MDKYERKVFPVVTVNEVEFVRLAENVWTKVRRNANPYFTFVVSNSEAFLLESIMRREEGRL